MDFTLKTACKITVWGILSGLMQVVLLTPSARAVEGTQAVSASPLPKVKIVLVGDSTVAPNGGWGPAFAKLLNSNAEVVNLARGGRSSRSFINEGHWKGALEQKADYILIQFGHNDQPGKGLERETDPSTTYPQFMGRYVDEARAAGAKPVLVTSLTRRHFTPEGRIKADLLPYVEAVKKLAVQKQVPVIDLHARSIELLNKIGPQAAAEFDRPGEDATKPDRTHLSDKGGEATAQLVAGELENVVPELGKYLLYSNQSTSAPSVTKADLVVAADGSGDFKTVQEAVDAVPADNQKRFVILVKPGVYKSHLVVPKDKPFITFRGEDAEKTILTNDLHVKSPGADGKEVGTIGSASVVISSPDFNAENITFENNAPHLAQALAIYVDGDRAVFRKCRFLGWQDTIRVRSGRQYFEECYISGRTDFIYGEATSWFEQCRIHVVETGGWITAANTPQEKPYGLIFSNCTITGEPGVKEMLGRPWRPYAHTVWLNTRMEDVIDPAGWNNWGKPENEKTVRYQEHGSKTLDGKLLDLSTRVPWAKVLTDEEAAQYTLSTVMGDWNPAPSLAAKIRIALAGDSTVTDDAGWGTGFKQLVGDGVQIINMSRGGRSSRSFIDEGRWSRTLALKPEYVLIQFGHNDQPGHGPERETDPQTTYVQYMARYVDEARAAGVQPVLVTPMTRRQFGAGGKINSTLAPYAEAVKKLAADKQVPLIDLHARSIGFFEQMGLEATNQLAPTKENGAYDGTHLNRKGSEAVAPLVVDELRKAVPALSTFFTANTEH